jgi:WD40 repeat protein
MRDYDQLLKNRGQSAELGACVTAVCFSVEGTAGFALGDGTLRLGVNGTTVQTHDGAVLALAAHPLGGFVSGGDDGRLMRTHAGTAEIAKFGSKWVEHVAAFPGKAPLIAAAVGKTVHLFTGAGEKLREMPHASTVAGVCFDAKGKRLAAAHYNGASLWFTSSTSAPKVLEWKGSHTSVVLHPEGAALVTTMQENALHGWTLPEGKHMRMSGYPAKTESIAFTRSGRWLASSGAESVICWPFFGGGPMGKAPLELGAGDSLVTRVAAHPQYEMVAAGYADGMVLLLDVLKEQVLPVCGPGRGPVTALAWDATGAHLAFGTETGAAAIVNLSA